MNPPPSSAFAFKPTRQPMLWAALAYALGITAGAYAWRPALWWIVATTAFVAAALYFNHRRTQLAATLALASFFLAGALQLQVSGPTTHSDRTINPYADGQELQLTAHVTRDGRWKTGSFGDMTQTLDIETEELETAEGEKTAVRSGIRLSIYSPDEETDRETPTHVARPKQVFHYGDRIRCTAKLRLPRNFRNPGAFDYEGYLAANNIAALGSAKAETVELLPGFSGSRLELWRTRAHASIIAKVHQLWPEREAALIDAMVIGEEAFIDRDTRTDFQRSGTYYILVVSGMNVSILAFVAFWTLRRARLAEIPATMLTVALCFAYAFLTDVGAPVWRATLMCTLYLGTRLLYRDRAMLNALGAAALGLLILDPRQLFTASFQMTFVCVLIVAAIGVPILERTSQLYKRALSHWDSEDYGTKLPPAVAQFRVDLRFIAQRLAPFIGERWSLHTLRLAARVGLATFELLFISAVMQVGLAVPMAYYFHRATTLGLPANVVVVPLTELLMPAAITALALGYISPLLVKIPALLTTFALHGITGTVRGLGGLRLADLRVPTPSLIMIALAVSALVFAMLSARRRTAIQVAGSQRLWAAWQSWVAQRSWWAQRFGVAQRFSAAIQPPLPERALAPEGPRLTVSAASIAITGLTALLAAALTLAFMPPKPQLQPGLLEITAIDVGQGDSTLLVTPQGQTLLIDAGGPIGGGSSQLDFGEDVVSPYLWTRGLARLDAVAITHGHSDHIGGIPAVLKNFRPRELWIGLLPPSPALEAIVAEAQALNIKVVRRWEGDELNLGGATITVLSPPRDFPPGSKPENNDSLVMRVSYGDSSALLEGDAQKQIERRIAALHHPQADLLRVGHHGSANATTEELLATAQPKFAVISDGLRNSFGMPRHEVLDRLGRHGVRVYRTDLEGAITFYLDGHSITPSVAALH